MASLMGLESVCRNNPHQLGTRRHIGSSKLQLEASFFSARRQADGRGSTQASRNDQNWLKNFHTSAGPQVFDAEPLSGNGVWSPTKEQNSVG